MKQLVSNLCKGTQTGNPKTTIPPCSDILPDETCRCYADPDKMWRFRDCPRSPIAGVKVSSKDGSTFKLDPIKQSKLLAKGKRKSK
jgi:hypothetical protein